MRLTILTDGDYPQCADRVGKVVDGTEFKAQNGRLKGYDITVRELRRVGALLDDSFAPDDELYFALNNSGMSDNLPEIEVTQDEYR